MSLRYSVADEVEANIAEYAVMMGMGWEAACRVAYKNYYTVLAAIHRERKPILARD